MTPRDRRALTLGATVVVPALLAMWVGRPAVAAFSGLRAEIVRERDLVQRERALLAAVPALDSSASALDGEMERAATRLFPGADPLVATAGLGSYVTDLARRHRVHVQQGETRPPVVVAGELVAVEVGVRARSDLEGALDFLAVLERGPRLVEVARLTIERGTSPREREPDQEILSISFVLRGYTDAPLPTASEGGSR